MKLLAAVLLSACASTPPPAPVAPPAPPAPKPVKPVELDDAAMIAKSHALFAAEDTNDEAGFRALVTPGFISLEDGRFFDVNFIAWGMKGRLERKAPARTHSCTEERVYRAPGAAIYIGDCTQKYPAEPGHADVEFEGWNTLVWTYDGDWKVAHWQWQKAGIEAERDMWNETFRKSVGFKQTANQFLIDTVKGKKPGAALDVLMGQGRNAIYLAAQGWKVSGVDISDEGIRIAKETAAKQKLKLDAINEDIDKYDFGTERWDLVTMIYAGSDDKTIEKLKPSIKHGGLFVTEFFFKDPSSDHKIGYEAGQLAKDFAGWKIVKDEVVEDVSDWGLRKTKLVRFIAQRP